MMGTMRLSYRICQFACQWFCILYFKVRCHGTRRVPASGGALLVCNHQSFMDPVLAAIALRRESSFMARDTLFANPLFKRLIKHLNAYPVKRNEADISAIKESLRRLKNGQVIVLFPEGTRTPDGKIHPLLPGLGAIAKKARVPIVPTLIDGIYQLWPRHQPIPAPGDVVIEYGEPIWPDDYADMSTEEVMNLIHDRLTGMQQRWHNRLPQRRLAWYQA